MTSALLDTNIRRAQPADAQALALVGAATFLESFAGLVDGADIVANCAAEHGNAERYAAWLASPDYAIWLVGAAPGDAPVGYCVLSPVSNLPVDDARADDLEIKRIYLLSRFHGSGLAAQMMVLALEEAARRGAGRVLIGVKDDNARAHAFYRKSGFTVAGTRSFTVGGGTYSDQIFAKEI